LHIRSSASFPKSNRSLSNNADLLPGAVWGQHIQATNQLFFQGFPAWTVALISLSVITRRVASHKRPTLSAKYKLSSASGCITSFAISATPFENASTGACVVQDRPCRRVFWHAHPPIVNYNKAVNYGTRVRVPFAGNFRLTLSLIGTISCTECDAVGRPLVLGAVCAALHRSGNCPTTTRFCCRPQKRVCGWQYDPKTNGRG
jgi:hypothetical protein